MRVLLFCKVRENMLSLWIRKVDVDVCGWKEGSTLCF
jgi:hypothetical protein